MNDWTNIRKTAIVEADDFMDKYDRNGLEMLFYWRAKYPNFKITLFTIPNKISPEMLLLISRHRDWINLAIHGWDHDSNFECWSWDYDKAKALVSRALSLWVEPEVGHPYVPIFKAPGWMITGNDKGEGSGYPLQSHNKLASDNQGVYKALKDLGCTVFDRHYNKQFRPEGLTVVCVDCNPNIIHMHTWDMETGDLNGKNGFRQVEELHGVPWNRETEFFFVSEAIEKGMFKPCQ